MSSAISECAVLGFYVALAKKMESMIISSHHIQEINESLSSAIDVISNQRDGWASNYREKMKDCELLERENADLRGELRLLKSKA